MYGDRLEWAKKKEGGKFGEQRRASIIVVTTAENNVTQRGGDRGPGMRRWLTFIVKTGTLLSLSPEDWTAVVVH